MAKAKGAVNGKKALTKEELRAREQRRAIIERRKMLSERKNVAISNMQQRRLGGWDDYDDYPVKNENKGRGKQAPVDTNSIDREFITDMQKVKFCRKPVGFLMSLIFLVCIALVAISFIDLGIPAVTTYTSLFSETEPKVEADTNGGGENVGETEGEENEGGEPANASQLKGASEESTDETGENTEGTGENAEGEDKKEESTAIEGTYTGFSDPIFGWISFIAGKFGLDIDLGNSPWYDAQISKVENGMADSFASILIQAFPAAIILYAIFALSLFIKTFICWASGDRRIYRHTGVESFIMIILALVVALGGFASTVEIDGALNFGEIVNFLIGGIMGKGGFTAGYGMLIMIALPVVGLILSFFLLERKLRDRDVIQPIIFYDARK